MTRAHLGTIHGEKTLSTLMEEPLFSKAGVSGRGWHSRVTWSYPHSTPPCAQCLPGTGSMGKVGLPRSKPTISREGAGVGRVHPSWTPLTLAPHPPAGSLCTSLSKSAPGSGVKEDGQPLGDPTPNCRRPPPHSPAQSPGPTEGARRLFSRPARKGEGSPGSPQLTPGPPGPAPARPPGRPGLGGGKSPLQAGPGLSPSMAAGPPPAPAPLPEDVPRPRPEKSSHSPGPRTPGRGRLRGERLGRGRRGRKRSGGRKQ
ncbi:basic proline-rich protein-like [Trichosurus vulpecula]|uniref:basic proline-rich protein-like n=1 Tax=Trichosurus vulpecula TaxID=9337 RepID=UPI00186B1EFB|nr:basic proline-rich protein-like [Trichosurus vulpecula]